MTNEMCHPEDSGVPRGHSARGRQGLGVLHVSQLFLRVPCAVGARMRHEPTRVLFRCPIHGHVGLCDGSVQGVRRQTASRAARAARRQALPRGTTGARPRGRQRASTDATGLPPVRQSTAGRFEPMNRRVLLGGFLVVVCLATLWGVWGSTKPTRRPARRATAIAGSTGSKRRRRHPPERLRPPAPVPATPPPALVATPELLRLRNEVTRLTERRRELAGVRAENERLRAQLASRGHEWPWRIPIAARLRAQERGADGGLQHARRHAAIPALGDPEPRPDEPPAGICAREG